MTAAFGHMRGEQNDGITPAVDYMRILPTATPWATQFHDDVLYCAQRNDEVRDTFASVSNHTSVFCSS